MQQEDNVIRLNAKDVLKLSKTDFIVKYGDGTQHEVNEGILIEANPDNSVTGGIDRVHSGRGKAAARPVRRRGSAGKPVHAVRQLRSGRRRDAGTAGKTQKHGRITLKDKGTGRIYR